MASKKSSRLAGFRDGEGQGVSTLLGELMMIVITIMIFFVVVGVVFWGRTIFTPAIHAEIRVYADPVADRITISHMGGDPVQVKDLVVGVSQNWSQISYPAFILVNSSGGADSSGTFTVGKRLMATMPVEAGQRLEIIIIDSRTSAVIASGVFVPAMP